MMVRTRMAPSPTGEFHIGGVRTLLYNYAFAKQQGGKFVLRIEDTDRERLVEGALERSLEDIKDYGMGWDEGPFIQSQRLEIYKKHAEELVEKGAAYYCFCTKERLEELKKDQQTQKLPVTKYDKKCANLSQDEITKNLSEGKPFVIRLNVPENENISFEDKVLGKIVINTNDIDDQVLLKSDGFPTYHLGVVVDDHLMEITHVMRGMEWLPSTPKHILLYRAFGWELPIYAHLPLLKEKGSNQKLSKRFGDVDARGFLAAGYLPEAILNFLMFLGWNPGTEKEIYSLEEFIQDFSIEHIHKTDLVTFDREKLLWFNGHYIRSLPAEDLHERILVWRAKYDVKLPAEFLSKDMGIKVLKLVQERLRKFDELPESVGYFFADPEVSNEMVSEFSDAEKSKTILSDFIELFSGLDNWTLADLDKASHELISQKGYKPKEAFMTVRIAVSGSKVTPPLFDILELIGKEKTLERLTTAQNV